MMDFTCKDHCLTVHEVGHMLGIVNLSAHCILSNFLRTFWPTFVQRCFLYVDEIINI